jgi:hypothetical protein
MRVTTNHLFATASDAFLDSFNSRSRHDQGADSARWCLKPCYAATFQAEFAKE